MIEESLFPPEIIILWIVIEESLVRQSPHGLAAEPQSLKLKLFRTGE